MTTNRSAFTLLEVVLVLALLVILAAISMPSIEAMYGDLKLEAAADLMRARFTEARAHAIEEGQAYQLAIMPGEEKFRVAPDRADYWSGGETPAPQEGEPTPLVQEDKLPKGVKFQSGEESSSNWIRVATFLPDGSCREDFVEITFSADGERPVVLKMRGLTGAVTVTSKPVGSN